MTATTMNENNLAARPAKGNRWIFVLLMLLFVLPVIFATVLYMTGWRPSSIGNHGELIQPARKIEAQSLHTLDGKAVDFSGLRNTWVMVVFGSSSCPEACLKSVFEMRQVHAAQAKEIGRVQRVFIATDVDQAEALKIKLVDYPEMGVWTGDSKALSALFQSFGISAGQPAEQQGIYLVDPLGNVMMRYPPGSNPSGMLKDLTRLLKYSWVG